MTAGVAPRRLARAFEEGSAGKTQSAAGHAALQIITRSKHKLTAGASRGGSYLMPQLARRGKRKVLEGDMHRQTALECSYERQAASLTARFASAGRIRHAFASVECMRASRR